MHLFGEWIGVAEWQVENAPARMICTRAANGLIVVFPPNSGRAARSLPHVIYIIPLFLSETATRSRVATPDSAIAASL
jgi:hypothetical protein